jgi:hypothetical protein
MKTKTDPSIAAALGEVSLSRGGPFYRAQLAARLIRSDQWNLVRRISFMIAVGWLPLLLTTALLNPGSMGSLIKDYRVYARLLIAVPVLLFGDVLMDSRFRDVVSQIRRAGLLEGPDLKYMDDVIATLIRLRNSLVPEFAILLLLITHTATSYKGLVDTSPWLARGTGADLHLTAAGWYGVLVSASMFQFLLGLSLWRWLLWTFFAYKLSKRNLKLFPTHPDAHGGLGFLGLTMSAFAPVTFAATTVVGSTWRQDILHEGAHLTEFKLPAIAWVVIVAIIALAPLAFFVPRLAALRRKGILEYGILGQLHSADFEEKWLDHRAGHEAEFLQAPDSIALAAFGNSYEKVEQMRPFPADPVALYALGAAILIPALPVVLAQIPLTVVLEALFKALR